MNRKISLLLMSLLVISEIIYTWPTSTNVPLPADVESAINSVEPLPGCVT